MRLKQTFKDIDVVKTALIDAGFYIFLLLVALSYAKAAGELMPLVVKIVQPLQEAADTGFASALTIQSDYRTFQIYAILLPTVWNTCAMRIR